MSAPKPTGPSPQEKQMLANKDKMLKKKIMMQKQAMQMQKQGKLALNYSEECEGDGKSKMKKKRILKMKIQGQCLQRSILPKIN